MIVKAMSCGVFFLLPLLCGMPARDFEARVAPAPARALPHVPAPAPFFGGGPLQRLGYRDYRGVIHCHSFLSHDSEGTQEHIIQSAKETGLDFLLMTDHQNDPTSIERGLKGMHGSTFFLPGSEVGVEGGGALLGVDLRRHIHGKTTLDKIKDARSQGGMALAGHCEGWKVEDLLLPGLSGMEVYNLHYDALLDGKMFSALGKMLKYLRTDPARGFRQLLDRPKLVLSKWDQVTQKKRMPGFGANDSHENVKFAGIQMDPYPRSFRFVNTHLLLRGDLTRERLREALSQGHAYICHEMFHDGAGFSFTVERGGEPLAIMGDELTLTEGMSLRVLSPTQASITLIRDGKGIGESGKAVREWTFPVRAPGVYRVELTVLDEREGNKVVPWIYSNPVYVRPAEKNRPEETGDEEF